MLDVCDRRSADAAAPFEGVYAGKRVLVTGHTGFKGSWLTTWLIAQGATICGLSKDVPTEPSLFALAGLEDDVRHEIGDVRDPGVVSELIEAFRPDFVFHLAAQALVSRSYGDPLETITTNVVGTANVLEALKSVRWPCAAVIVTSDKCYDNLEWVWGYRETDALGGKDVYSGSKGAAELVFKSFYNSFFTAPSHPVTVAVARAGNVVGGGDWAADRIVADAVRAWSGGRAVEVRSPSATRPWQHVLEPLSGYLALAQDLSVSKRHAGQAFNFGPRAEQNRTVVDMLEELSRIWGFESPDDAFVVTGHSAFHEASLLKLNCDKALLQLGWEATLSYEDCLRMTGEWYRDVLRRDRCAATCTIEQIDAYVARARAGGRVWASVR